MTLINVMLLQKMFIKVIFSFKRFITKLAFDFWFLSFVNLKMSGKVPLKNKRLVTYFTTERFYVAVSLSMPLKTKKRFKGFVTNFANMGLLVAVNQSMPLKVTFGSKGFVTMFAHIQFLISVT